MAEVAQRWWPCNSHSEKDIGIDIHRCNIYTFIYIYAHRYDIIYIHLLCYVYFIIIDMQCILYCILLSYMYTIVCLSYVYIT